MLLLFFLPGVFLGCVAGVPEARLALFLGVFGVLGVLLVLGVLAGRVGAGSSSIRRCFSFSGFFFFFLSFFSFFFLGLTMGPWERAVSCSWTAFSWRGRQRGETEGGDRGKEGERRRNGDGEGEVQCGRKERI